MSNESDLAVVRSGVQDDAAREPVLAEFRDTEELPTLKMMPIEVSVVEGLVAALEATLIVNDPGPWRDPALRWPEGVPPTCKGLCDFIRAKIAAFRAVIE